MYWTHTDTIIFYPEFNDTLDAKLLGNYKKIIFSNYAFNENVYKNIYDNKINENDENYDNYWKYNHYYVYFNFDESKVLPKYQYILDGLIEDLKKFPDHKLLIHGHTDSDGESIYNIYLGEARANEVMKYLVDRGVSHSKIRTFTYGQTNPAEPNTSIDKKAKNRRVEIILLTK